MVITVDTREQCPFPFTGKTYEGTTIEVSGLPIGDYSVKGLHDVVAVERKSLPDLVGCLGRDRERFERELLRARALESFSIVVESDFQTLAKGNYRSELKPHSACQSVAAFAARYRIPIFFAGSRQAAEYICWSLLRQFVKGKQHELRAVAKAVGE